MKPLMKSKIYNTASIIICVVVISSCIATNNMYLNNPIPLPKGEGDAYIAIGTGLEARLDSSLSGGQYITDYKTQIAPVFSFGGQFGITQQFDLRAAIHLPYALGGFGFRVGSQYSFLNSTSAFNVALGTDFGLAFTRDSLFHSEIESDARGMYNMDAFLPFSYSFTDDVSLIITPRYTLSWISVDNIYNEKKAQYFRLNYPIISVGLMIKGLYLESSALFTKEKMYPQFGIGFIFEH